MGLKLMYGLVYVILPIALVGCMAKSVATPVRNKYYIDCCNPTLTAHEKDMCRWAKENPNRIIVEGNSRYEMLWSDCGAGKEYWRRWED